MMIVPWTEFAVGPLRSPILVLMGAVGCVLLIACSNIAGLMLARSGARSREIAVRAALGAGRWRLIQQTMAESLVLSVLGTAAGLFLALGGIRLLLLLAPETVSQSVAIRIDGWVLAFTAAAGILAGLLFGLAPAWQVARIGRYDSLKEGAVARVRLAWAGRDCGRFWWPVR